MQKGRFVLKKKKLLTVLVILAGIIIGGMQATGIGTAPWRNRQALKKNMRALALEEPGTVVSLSELTPFQWDLVYSSFEPYTSKDDIEQVLKLKSPLIQETVSEGMVQLFFVKYEEHSGENKLVCSVCGYPEALGYRMEFGQWMDGNSYISVDKQTDKFILSLKEGIPCLTFAGKNLPLQSGGQTDAEIQE